MSRKPSGLHIGPAGIPHSTKKKSTPEGVRRVAELGLDAMEIEFVRGVRMSDKLAEETRKAAEESGVILTVHAPYYVNLLSSDPAKVEASIKRILDSARAGYKAGAWSVVFHPGYYGKTPPGQGVRRIREALKKIIKQLKDEGIEIWIRPETMGGLAEIGSLEEVIDMVDGIDNASIAIDFAHLYARSLGEFNTYEKFSEALELIEKRLGNETLKNMHIHMSGMEYGPRGERKHLNFHESEFQWENALKALKDFNVKGVLICESPSLEDDALKIRNVWHKILRSKPKPRRVA